LKLKEMALDSDVWRNTLEKLWTCSATDYAVNGFLPVL